MLDTLVPALGRRAALLGTLQRHGLVAQNDKTGEAIEKYAKAFEDKLGKQYAQEGRAGAFRPSSVPRVSNPASLAPEPTWSPTELASRRFSASVMRGRNCRTRGLQGRPINGPINRNDGSLSGPVGQRAV